MARLIGPSRRSKAPALRMQALDRSLPLLLESERQLQFVADLCCDAEGSGCEVEGEGARRWRS